ncbi:MAG: DPP IV N-terminal domain-containing protein, partial [Chitinophagaceae bacterium]|nr:DPP IV N-terminal domain-containing protein [Chitinophagaceae bacterium]
MRPLLFLLLFVPVLSIAQKKQITLEDLFKKGTFRGESFHGFENESSDSLFDPKNVVDETGKKINTDIYEFSGDKKRILFFNGREPIYRRSSKASVYLYDVATKKVILLNQGKILHPTFSPDGSKVAYVFDNNLYVYDVSSGKNTAVTTDGKWNYIINGNCDWVYEEEFSFSRAFQWSPNSAYLAYYRFDESNVKEYNLIIYDSLYNKDYRYKYPKAGEANSIVDIYIYNVGNGQKVKAQYQQGDIYIPRIKWTQAGNNVVVYWMNRLQNNLKLLLTDATTGASRL